MTDLISRQAVLKELPHALWGKEWDEALAKAIIESMPTIDPVKRGKWIAKRDGWNGGFVVCSVCFAENGMNSKFCPHCGAIMDGEE